MMDALGPMALRMSESSKVTDLNQMTDRMFLKVALLNAEGARGNVSNLRPRFLVIQVLA